MTISPPVTIDPLVEADVDAAIAIDLVSFVPSELGLERENPRAVREKSLREELVRSWARLRAARDAEGDLVGYALFWHVVDEVHLLNIAVAIPARRLGVGRALMEDLLTYARSHAVARILLEARSGNVAALKLYRQFGFEEYAVRERYYADGEDAVEMSLVLTTA